VSLRACNL